MRRRAVCHPCHPGGRDLFCGARHEFCRWRNAKKPGSRIPDRLWSLAVELARVHGVWRTARELGLDPVAVKKRLSMTTEVEKTSSDHGLAGAFVELPGWGIAPTSECVLELVDEDGRTRLRIATKGAAMAELTALAQSLWRGRR